jgi:hypothetical protein
MLRDRRRAALCRAVDAARIPAYLSEPLEQRVLLAANDPVIVFTEPLNFTTWPTTVNEDTVRPWLWENPEEYHWDLSDQDWNLTDGDGNGFRDDAYGWSFNPVPGFANGTPSMIAAPGQGAHGATIVSKVLLVLQQAAMNDNVRVRIMHVIGPGDQVAAYIVQQKNSDANIVAVSDSSNATVFTRADIELLGENDILYFPAVGNDNLNRDPETGSAAPDDPFFNATPRSGIQQPAVQTIIPVTTDPAVAMPPTTPTNYGINSFYFSTPAYVPGTSGQIEAQSWAAPVAATYAALAVQDYQDKHSGETPHALDIKRAMMSGLTYQSNLGIHTISHDYVNGQRVNGGVLDLDTIIDAINDDGPGITNVHMSDPSPDDLGTEILFALNSIGTPTNWTISWGDNSFSDGSGVEVLPGAQGSRSHKYPFENLPHHYFPTIYAMLGTGNGRQVYLQSSQLNVEVTTPFAPTSGQDNYIFTRSGTSTVLTMKNAAGAVVYTHTFPSGTLPTCLITRGPGGGEGADTLTVDLANGNPLASTALRVGKTGAAENLVRVIGSSGADTITNVGSSVFLGQSLLLALNNNALKLYLDGAGGNDTLTSNTNPPLLMNITLAGGAGDDTLNLPGGKGSLPEVLDGGDGIDTVFGVSAPDTMDQAVEYFVKIENNIRHVYRYDVDNAKLFSLTQDDGETTLNVEDALFAVTIDQFKNMTYGDGELVPIQSVLSLVVNGQNKDEYFDIEASVDVTVNAAGGADYITVIAPNATINGGAGNDEIHTGNTGDYHIDLGTGTNSFFGGNGTDYVVLASGAYDTIFLGGGDDTVDARGDLADDDYINGGTGSDTLKLVTGHPRTTISSIENIEYSSP